MVQLAQGTSTTSQPLRQASQKRFRCQSLESSLQRERRRKEGKEEVRSFLFEFVSWPADLYGSIEIAFSLYYFLQAKKTAETIIGSDPDLAEGSETIVLSSS